MHGVPVIYWDYNSERARNADLMATTHRSGLSLSQIHGPEPAPNPQSAVPRDTSARCLQLLDSLPLALDKAASPDGQARVKNAHALSQQLAEWAPQDLQQVHELGKSLDLL